MILQTVRMTRKLGCREQEKGRVQDIVEWEIEVNNDKKAIEVRKDDTSKKQEERTEQRSGEGRPRAIHKKKTTDPRERLGTKEVMMRVRTAAAGEASLNTYLQQLSTDLRLATAPSTATRMSSITTRFLSISV